MGGERRASAHVHVVHVCVGAVDMLGQCMKCMYVCTYICTYICTCIHLCLAVRVHFTELGCACGVHVCVCTVTSHDVM